MRISYGSLEETAQEELRNPRFFEGGKMPAANIAELAKRMREYDPTGKKALLIARKYR